MRRMNATVSLPKEFPVARVIYPEILFWAKKVETSDQRLSEAEASTTAYEATHAQLSGLRFN